MGAPTRQRRMDSADAGTITVWREDRGELLSSQMRPDGCLLVSGYAAREGILVYRNADGTTTREYVSREVLADSAKTLARAPLTLGHPSSDVSPENVGRLGVGDVGERVTIHDDGFVQVTMAVRRKDAIDAIRNGIHELSPGYICEVDNIGGRNKYGEFDRSQLSRTVNHLALVEAARGGTEVRIRADGADVAVSTETITAGKPASPPPSRSNTMIPPRLGILLARLGVSTRFDSTETGIDLAIDALDARRDAADKADAERNDALAQAITERDALKGRADKADAEAKTEKARADGLAAEVASLKAADKARADAAERADLVSLAEHVKVDATKYPGTPELRTAVVSAHLAAASKTLRKDATDAHVDVILDEIRDARKDAAVGLAAGGQVWSPTGEVRADGLQVPAPKRNVMADRWGGRPLPRGGE
jgi:hypothetical protein